MPADTDHLRRDAFHAARSDISVAVQKYVRRFYADAKAHIETVLAEAEGELDGTELGREAARLAVAKYLGAAEPSEAIESGRAAIDAAADA